MVTLMCSSIFSKKLLFSDIQSIFSNITLYLINFEEKMHIFVARLGFTRQPPEPKRAHLTAPALQTHQKSTRRPSREGRKEREILALHPSGPQPFGPPPSNTPPLHQKKKAKFGQIRLAKCGQTRMAKSDLAKCGRDRSGWQFHG